MAKTTQETTSRKPPKRLTSATPWLQAAARVERILGALPPELGNLVLNTVLEARRYSMQQLPAPFIPEDTQ